MFDASHAERQGRLEGLLLKKVSVSCGMFKALITGITMGLYLAISVGPILFTVINNRLNYGIKGGFSFVAGIWLSDVLFVLLSNVFTVFTIAFADAHIHEIGYSGALLLVGLGLYYALFKKAVIKSIDNGKLETISNVTLLKLFGSGFLINTINPILFFEWLTAATVFARTYSVANRVVIFAACLLINIFSDILKIFLAGKIKERLTAHHLNIVNRCTGAVLVICGVFVFYQTCFHSDKWKASANIYNEIAVFVGISRV